MPGLFGITGARSSIDPISVFTQHGPTSGNSESLLDPRHEWAIGRSHLGALQPTLQLSPGERIHVLFHGDLNDVDQLRRRLEAPTASPAALIRALWEQGGAATLAQLDGAFCLAIVDTVRRQTVLAVDRYGAYPLHWTTAGGQFVFGSSLQFVLKHPGAKRDLNPHAVGDYLTFGFLLGDKTLATGAEMVPQGSTVTFDWDTARVTTSRLTTVAEQFAPWSGSRAEFIEALCAAFQESVTRSLSGDVPFGVSLSGGLDSRAILGAMNGQASGIATYTLGVKGCADEVIADKLARITGTNHTFFELDDRYLREFLPNLRRMVSLTDGMYLSHGLTEMLALGFLESASFSVLVRGHGGELAKTNLAWPLHTDSQAAQIRSQSDFVSYLLRRTNYIDAGLEVQDLFEQGWASQIDGAARRSLGEAIAGVDLTPLDLCSYLYLTQHHRRSTIASIELFRHAVDVRMPFVDSACLRVLFRGRSEWRADTTIHQALTAAGNKALLRVRNSNTGAPANAGPLTEYALDKVNTLLKRLNVHGYRHYHNFQAWMREQLLTSVETVLLSRDSLARGVLREAGVRRLLDDTRSDRGDHSYLLQTLLILELWQQENL